MAQDEARLARIEVQLDKINESLVVLARVEERMAAFMDRLDNTHELIRGLSTAQQETAERVDELEYYNAARSGVNKWAERVSMAFIGAIATAVVAVASVKYWGVKP